LDKKASGPAKRAISGWLEPKEYDKAAVGRAVVELFDWVYTQPLGTWLAFFRSAIITFVITMVAIFELVPFSDIAAFHEFLPFTLVGVIPDILLSFTYVITNLLSDYIALIIIRRLLVRTSPEPFKALLLGPLLGICLVVGIMVERDIVVWVMHDI